jgi:hypothetical protein
MARWAPWPSAVETCLVGRLASIPEWAGLAEGGSSLRGVPANGKQRFLRVCKNVASYGQRVKFQFVRRCLDHTLTQHAEN